MKQDATDGIVLEGARTHNLKNVRCVIPRAALTVVSGVSGSGKSSLAFDTLYAEGQRRYVESMSTYARQFLERMQRPDVDSVTGVPPAIAIEQRNSVRNARSTVGTVTEISDYLRLLYARAGVVHCPDCGGVVARDTATAAAAAVIKIAGEARVQVVAPAALHGGDVATRVAELSRDGYRRLLLDGEVVELSDADPERLRALRVLPLLVDRLKAEPTRLADALVETFALAEGRAEVHVEGRAEPLRFDEGYSCSTCGRVLKAPSPALFSFNSPLGACETCQGFGRVIGVDLDKVIPDGRKTLAEGAIQPFTTPSNAECQDDLVKLARKHRRTRLDVPWRELDDDERAWVLDGDPGYKPGGWKRGQWYGVRGFFRYLESKKYKMHVRVMLARYRGYDPCTACGGSRLRAEARAVLLDGKSIAELEAMAVSELRPFVDGVRASLPKQARATAAPLLVEIDSRLAYLDEVGLGYLSLGRQARTLSGGEAQRIALASALGARLTGTLYVLDEPSVGLHPRDSYRLVRVLRKLTERGNTAVVVEHDPEIMREADWVIDLGPGAGARGGEVVFAGTYAELLRDRRSRTGAFLRERARPSPRETLREPAPSKIAIAGARAHNLRGVDVEFPVGRFSCVTGVSGSGKSTLVVDVLYAQALRARGKPVDFVGACDGVSGLDGFDDVVLVDQSPLGRSSRSNPATYLKAMDELRQRFARTAEAERLGLKAGAFSFNVAGGRCEGCLGQGTVTLEMHFLADVTVECDQCNGRRFKEQVLGVKWRGSTILDCLALTVDEALERFADDEKLCARLRPFAEVGLGYLALGQSTATLSGGESQRLKLAAHLHAGGGPTLFLLDEPTTGLHGLDVELLLGALGRLVDAGHTVIAIEHNLDFMRRADWLIDLGPEGGAAGGTLVAAGTPDEVARERASHTGRALAALLHTERRRG
ncbi:MAG TPA: excinuclease ABC subunit UvrA [Polyangia bacterium]|nr:excinuclease ABC subunit UvrA [Polyangia bacterium]